MHNELYSEAAKTYGQIVMRLTPNVVFAVGAVVLLIAAFIAFIAAIAYLKSPIFNLLVKDLHKGFEELSRTLKSQVEGLSIIAKNDTAIFKSVESLLAENKILSEAVMAHEEVLREIAAGIRDGAKSSELEKVVSGMSKFLKDASETNRATNRALGNVTKSLNLLVKHYPQLDEDELAEKVAEAVMRLTDDEEPISGALPPPRETEPENPTVSHQDIKNAEEILLRKMIRTDIKEGPFLAGHIVNEAVIKKIKELYGDTEGIRILTEATDESLPLPKSPTDIYKKAEGSTLKEEESLHPKDPQNTDLARPAEECPTCGGIPCKDCDCEKTNHVATRPE